MNKITTEDVREGVKNLQEKNDQDINNRVFKHLYGDDAKEYVSY